MENKPQVFEQWGWFKKEECIMNKGTFLLFKNKKEASS